MCVYGTRDDWARFTRGNDGELCPDTLGIVQSFRGHYLSQRLSANAHNVRF